MKYEFKPFEDGMIAEAGRLLAQRRKRDRAAQPLLPERFEDPEVAANAVQAVWRRSYSSGIAAFASGAMAGYLIGDRVADTLRGRHVWMRLPGHALAEGVDAELYRDLYAAAGREWLAKGHFDHFILVPASEQGALDAFFALSFGKEQTLAVCDLPALTIPPVAPGPWTIRAGTKDDRERLTEASGWLTHHLAGAPVWGAALPERLEDNKETYAAVVDDDTATIWLAEEDGRLVGIALFFRQDPQPDDPEIGDDCVSLSVGVTRPGERGRGIGTALAWHGLAEVQARGFRTCIADWRITNLEASRFWPRFGFQPMSYRLVRRVDNRVVWAR